MEATRIGIDLAKNWFHLVAMDSRGQVIWRRALARRRVLEELVQLKPALVTMEACATAHYWAREIQQLGHEVKLIHPAFVVPFRKSGKNDLNDAEALCEASCRPTMRFVEVKSVAQQDIQSLHRARRLLIKHRTQLSNQLRGLLAEYGIAVRCSISALRREAAELAAQPQRLTVAMRLVVSTSLEQLRVLEQQLAQLDQQIARMCGSDERCRRLAQVPGVGPLTATAMVAKVGNARQFTNGRALAAYLGLVPRQHSTGGKSVLLSITKKGDRYLRTLLIHGARAALKVAPRHDDRRSHWVLNLRLKSGPNVAAVALANKNARLLWKLLISGEPFRSQPLSPEAEIDGGGSRKRSQQSKGRSGEAPALPVYPPRAPSPHTAQRSLYRIERAGKKSHLHRNQ